MGILNNVAIQWLIRRIPELAGIVVTLVTFYNSIPPQYQAVILSVITGKGGGLTVSALIGFALWAYAQWTSYRATVRPQVVTADKEQRPLSPSGAREVEAVTSLAAPRKRTLIDVLLGK